MKVYILILFCSLSCVALGGEEKVPNIIMENPNLTPYEILHKFYDGVTQAATPSDSDDINDTTSTQRCIFATLEKFYNSDFNVRRFSGPSDPNGPLFPPDATAKIIPWFGSSPDIIRANPNTMEFFKKEYSLIQQSVQSHELVSFWPPSPEPQNFGTTMPIQYEYRKGPNNLLAIKFIRNPESYADVAGYGYCWHK